MQARLPWIARVLECLSAQGMNLIGGFIDVHAPTLPRLHRTVKSVHMSGPRTPAGPTSPGRGGVVQGPSRA